MHGAGDADRHADHGADEGQRGTGKQHPLHQQDRCGHADLSRRGDERTGEWPRPGRQGKRAGSHQAGRPDQRDLRGLVPVEHPRRYAQQALQPRIGEERHRYGHDTGQRPGPGQAPPARSRGGVGVRVTAAGSPDGRKNREAGGDQESGVPRRQQEGPRHPFAVVEEGAEQSRSHAQCRQRDAAAGPGSVERRRPGQHADDRQGRGARNDLEQRERQGRPPVAEHLRHGQQRRCQQQVRPPA
jgi:hypothetical protein